MPQTDFVTTDYLQNLPYAAYDAASWCDGVFGESGLAVHITVLSLHALTLLSLATVLVEMDLARTTHSGASLGRTVGVMDWDSHRYLECFFAVPMLGSVLMTVNVRLAPEQRETLLTRDLPRARALAADLGVVTNLDVLDQQLAAGGDDTATAVSRIASPSTTPS